MRMKQRRVTSKVIKNKVVTKDSEGVPTITYANPCEMQCEIWPATDRLQAQTYGDRINSIMNMRIRGKYQIQTVSGVRTYFFDGISIREGDGVCVYDTDPDYKIISIKPYKPLKLEIERLI